jgi:glucosamine 6-phosphate synthetase-like amidotransferase/phosphosugar isomerase protein
MCGIIENYLELKGVDIDQPRDPAKSVTVE